MPAKDGQWSVVSFSGTVRMQEMAIAGEPGHISGPLGLAAGGNGTALYDALYTSMVVASANDARGLVVVLSDGLNTSSWLSELDVTVVAERSDVVVYVVSANRSVAQTGLARIAVMTGARVMIPRDGRAIEDALNGGNRRIRAAVRADLLSGRRSDCRMASVAGESET